MSLVLLVEQWNKLDSRGNHVLFIAGSVGRKTKKGGSLVISDISMVVLFTGLATAVLFPTRGEKPVADAATS
jgi:hypothetical protein